MTPERHLKRQPNGNPPARKADTFANTAQLWSGYWATPWGETNDRPSCSAELPSYFSRTEPPKGDSRRSCHLWTPRFWGSPSAEKINTSAKQSDDQIKRSQKIPLRPPRKIAALVALTATGVNLCSEASLPRSRIKLCLVFCLGHKPL